MDLQSQKHASIAELEPSIDVNNRAIHGIVTLVWPYSSSQKSSSVLLVEPDFRLRRKKGQVRVTFTGESAKAVTRSGLISGDEVILRLIGVKWEHTKTTTETPGRGIDWELNFDKRLVLEILRGSEPPLLVDLDYATSTAEPEALHDDTPPFSHQKTDTASYRAEIACSVTESWSSPAFLKRKILPGVLFFGADHDPLTDEISIAESPSRKRIKFGRAVDQWTYADRIPSPQKDIINAEHESAVQQEVAILEAKDGQNFIQSNLSTHNTIVCPPRTIPHVGRRGPESPLDGAATPLLCGRGVNGVPFVTGTGSDQLAALLDQHRETSNAVDVSYVMTNLSDQVNDEVTISQTSEINYDLEDSMQPNPDNDEVNQRIDSLRKPHTVALHTEKQFDLTMGASSSDSSVETQLLPTKISSHIPLSRLEEAVHEAARQFEPNDIKSLLANESSTYFIPLLSNDGDDNNGESVEDSIRIENRSRVRKVHEKIREEDEYPADASDDGPTLSLADRSPKFDDLSGNNEKKAGHGDDLVEELPMDTRQFDKHCKDLTRRRDTRHGSSPHGNQEVNYSNTTNQSVPVGLEMISTCINNERRDSDPIPDEQTNEQDSQQDASAVLHEDGEPDSDRGLSAYEDSVQYSPIDTVGFDQLAAHSISVPENSSTEREAGPALTQDTPGLQAPPAIGHSDHITSNSPRSDDLDNMAETDTGDSFSIEGTSKYSASVLGESPDVPTSDLGGEDAVHETIVEQPAIGFRTRHSYYLPLSALAQHVDTNVDTFAIVVSTSKVGRAKTSSRDATLTLYITDPSTISNKSSILTATHIFRPKKSALPTLDIGNVILLRNFQVLSRKRKTMLQSTGSSAWAVFYKEGIKMNGAPVEFGDEERTCATSLDAWWAALNDSVKEKILAAVPKGTDSRTGGKKGRQTGSLRLDERHELRDGFTYTNEPSVDRNDVHELRDGTIYRDSDA